MVASETSPRYVQLGTTDLNVSHIGFGCAGLGNEYGGLTDADATAVVSHAIERGITYFDTSAYYGRGLSERRLGKALKGRREGVVVATKGGRFDASPETGFDFSYASIVDMCNTSLERLQTDYIDVYQLHDIEFGDRQEVLEEAWRAMVDLKHTGAVRYIGVTGYLLPILDAAVEELDPDTVLSYCRYNLMDRSMEDNLVATAQRKNTAIINASILHMGMLSDRGPQDWHPAPQRIKDAARRVVDFCENVGVSVSEVAIQFALANPDVAVTLLGSNRIETLDRSLDAAAKELDEDLLTDINKVIGTENLNLAWASGRPENWDPLVEV